MTWKGQVVFRHPISKHTEDNTWGCSALNWFTPDFICQMDSVIDVNNSDPRHEHKVKFQKPSGIIPSFELLKC